MWKRRVIEGDIDLHIANSWEIKKKKDSDLLRLLLLFMSLMFKF